MRTISVHNMHKIINTVVAPLYDSYFVNMHFSICMSVFAPFIPPPPWLGGLGKRLSASVGPGGARGVKHGA